MKKILTVTEVRSFGGRGVLVIPRVPESFFAGKALPRKVEIRFKNGSRILKDAEFILPWECPPPKQYSYGCHISGVDKSELPEGAEIWAEIDEG